MEFDLYGTLLVVGVSPSGPQQFDGVEICTAGAHTTGQGETVTKFHRRNVTGGYVLGPRYITFL